MYHHRLVRDGSVIYVYTNDKLTDLKFDAAQHDEIRWFMKLPEGVAKQKLEGLLGPQCETEFDTE